MTSTRPYLLRAFYEWMCDNTLTPYVIINVNLPEVEVPKQYVENDQIVLNISPQAINALELGNKYISFEARFSGILHYISAPIHAVLAVYAQENGQGVVFGEDEGEEPEDDTPPPPKPTKGKTKAKGKPNLRVVK